MDSAATFLGNWAEATWAMVVDSALLLLLSFVLAGLLHLVLNARTIGKLVSGGRRREVFATALVGVPLPLCSCSVLPVAYQLRRAGVSKAGTTAFLIATPESGVDSVLLTWSLMDPLMTVARPVAAFLTAFTAGNIEAAFPDDRPTGKDGAAAGGDGCACGCVAESNAAVAPVRIADRAPSASWLSRVLAGIRYGFTDLFSDLAVYLLVGYLLAGLVAAVFGSALLSLPPWLTAGWGGYAGAIVIGLPLYICATSSTPLAAALLGAGFSPGAVLVFLLVGPATNVASMTVVGKILKGWGLARYLGSIVIVAVLCGIALDWAYRTVGIAAAFRAGGHDHASWYHVAAGLLFVLLLARVLAMKIRRRLRRGRMTPAAG